MPNQSHYELAVSELQEITGRHYLHLVHKMDKMLRSWSQYEERYEYLISNEKLRALGAVMPTNTQVPRSSGNKPNDKGLVLGRVLIDSVMSELKKREGEYSALPEHSGRYLQALVLAKPELVPLVEELKAVLKLRATLPRRPHPDEQVDLKKSLENFGTVLSNNEKILSKPIDEESRIYIVLASLIIYTCGIACSIYHRVFHGAWNDQGSWDSVLAKTQKTSEESRQTPAQTMQSSLDNVKKIDNFVQDVEKKPSFFSSSQKSAGSSNDGKDASSTGPKT